jgi:hypothetical protein
MQRQDGAIEVSYGENEARSRACRQTDDGTGLAADLDATIDDLSHLRLGQAANGPGSRNHQVTFRN